MKPDEIKLLVLLYQVRPKQSAVGPNVGDVGSTIGMHRKRTGYLLHKWTHKGLWDYGVSARTGWLTQAGIELAQTLLRANRESHCHH